MDSARLPGKALLPVAGSPLALLVAERTARASALEGRVVLATTTRRADDPLARAAEDAGVAVVRGPVDDVSLRALVAAESLGWDAFARVNADSPLVDADLLDEAVAILTREGVDFVTNLVPRTYPYGVAAEVMRTAAYRAWYANFDDADREHVTRYLYRHLDSLRWASCSPCTPDQSRERLTIDTAEDWRRVSNAIVEACLPADKVTYRDLFRLAAGVCS
jgi:spore coat polysaccharide biosynthesis protein SpsF